MLPRVTALGVTACLICAPTQLTSQILGTGSLASVNYQTGITFTLQVNLTQLSPDLDRVGFTCMVYPSEVVAYPFPGGPSQVSYATWPWPLSKDELPVVSGQVVGTMRVVVPFASEWFTNPIGQSARYDCVLWGLSRSLGKWDLLSETSTVPAFLVKPLPRMGGTFVW